MVKYNEKRIIYSLHYGGFMPQKAKIIIAVPFVLLFVICLTLTICLSVDRGGFLKDDDTIAGFSMTIISLLILFIFPIVNIRKNNIEKKYRLWLADENLVETYSHPFISEVTYSRGVKLHKFWVSIPLNGTRITRFSQHFDNVILLYKDKPMRLLYSPKYDEVLIVES